MDIDKVWVEKNIDHIMNTFIGSHPQFKLKDKSSQSAKRRHKKNMLENMDTMVYRPIYQLARFTKKTAKALQEKIADRDQHIRELNEEIDDLETINHNNCERYKEEKDKCRKLKEDNSTLKKYNERLLDRIAELEKI
tara:strand:- start:109 stop:519 length:411 start_codon:yes stop_codon:yes gene_type:complete